MDPVYKPLEIKQGADVTNDEGAQSIVDVKSVGLFGIPGLQLENDALISKGKSVKLESGVRLVVQVEIFGRP